MGGKGAKSTENKRTGLIYHVGTSLFPAGTVTRSGGGGEIRVGRDGEQDGGQRAS